MDMYMYIQKNVVVQFSFQTLFSMVELTLSYF